MYRNEKYQAYMCYVLILQKENISKESKLAFNRSELTTSQTTTCLLVHCTSLALEPRTKKDDQRQGAK
jgi:hypothetical protein